ncbi:hypothetical protein ACUOAQ_13415, partial [Escherichia sp. SP-MK]
MKKLDYTAVTLLNNQ